MFIVSCKPSSSAMRPYQTSWVCFATRQELQQGWGLILWDRFPKRSVLPIFRHKFHWSPSNERNVPSLVFTQSLLCCTEKGAQPRIFLLCWCLAALENTADWEADRGNLYSTCHREEEHMGHLPCSQGHGWTSFSALIKFHWNKENWVHRGMKQLAPTKSVLHILHVSLSSLGAFLGKRKNSPFV